jgi:hypothetical protein
MGIGNGNGNGKRKWKGKVKKRYGGCGSFLIIGRKSKFKFIFKNLLTFD